MMNVALPSHLKRYIVEQDYSRYSAIDQAVWRFIMRRLKNYLSQHAHECYVEGLEKTGISTEYIPKISEMSEKLSPFGWRACAVSGFIPPAAFMELQSLSVLPIACDMRTLEHAMYTPAPDIVHEAAGHAPILVNSEFAKYLKEYAQVAKKAILNKEDLDIYAAIRVLSDLKENPAATNAEIAAANKNLEKATAAAVEPSEAALLARMNWWTAEYGLVGDISNPRIYGAGLLSSVGESYTALQNSTKKIPFSLECLNFSYDITEPQPQLFVTPDFNTLTKALREMAENMAFKRGGVFGLARAKKSRTVNTVELDSGIQISGVLKDYVEKSNQPVYLMFDGPSQLSYDNKELQGHGHKRHGHGFGTPVGKFNTQDLKMNSTVELKFESGVVVKGHLKSELRKNGKLLLLTLSDCTVSLDDKILFDPSWGEFDMAVGHDVTHVFGGAADRDAYGETDDFEARRVPPHPQTPETRALNEIYSRIRKLRENPSSNMKSELATLIDRLEKDFPKDWLSRLEIYEICKKNKIKPTGFSDLESFLAKMASADTAEGMSVRDGLKLIEDEL